MAGPKNPKRGPQSFVTDRNKPTKKKPKPKKVETHEERRARGASIRGTPLAMNLDAAIRKRLR